MALRVRAGSYGDNVNSRKHQRLPLVCDPLVQQLGRLEMLGCLIKKGTTNEENKIPLLGDIPLLGWAFKYGKKSNAKTELLVMMTPT